MTNFEKIKNMTKEELAAFLSSKIDCSCCDATKECVTFRNCPKGISAWLDAEAEEKIEDRH